MAMFWLMWNASTAGDTRHTIGRTDPVFRQQGVTIFVELPRMLTVKFKSYDWLLTIKFMLVLCKILLEWDRFCKLLPNFSFVEENISVTVPCFQCYTNGTSKTLFPLYTEAGTIAMLTQDVDRTYPNYTYSQKDYEIRVYTGHPLCWGIKKQDAETESRVWSY